MFNPCILINVFNKYGTTIVYSREPQVKVSKLCFFLSLNDEIQHIAAFHLGHHYCLGVSSTQSVKGAVFAYIR